MVGHVHILKALFIIRPVGEPLLFPKKCFENKSDVTYTFAAFSQINCNANNSFICNCKSSAKKIYHIIFILALPVYIVYTLYNLY